MASETCRSLPASWSRASWRRGWLSQGWQWEARPESREEPSSLFLQYMIIVSVQKWSRWRGHFQFRRLSIESSSRLLTTVKIRYKKSSMKGKAYSITSCVCKVSKKVLYYTTNTMEQINICVEVDSVWLRYATQAEMEPIDANIPFYWTLQDQYWYRRCYSYEVFYKVAILFALLYPSHECHVNNRGNKDEK